MFPVPATALDYRSMARRHLPAFLFDYIDGGAECEITMRANAADLAAVKLRQRVMRDVSEVRTETHLFGEKWSMPVALAPVGLAGMYARRGESLAARAAAQAGVPFCLSSVGICDADEVRVASGTSPWFQLYMIKDRGVMKDVLASAQASGCRVLLLTVDLPIAGLRHRDVRNRLASPPSLSRTLKLGADIALRPGWAWDVFLRGRPHSLGSFVRSVPEASSLEDFGGWVSRNYDPSLTWGDLGWIRDRWQGPIVVKGILDAADAESAVCAGADGIVVSNHGGRQLDGASSSVSILPLVCRAVGGKVPVLLDGGVRTGADVLRALALGANGCLIGRAWAYGLAANGLQGALNVLEMFRRELTTAMSLTGCVSVEMIDHQVLAHDLCRRDLRNF